MFTYINLCHSSGYYIMTSTELPSSVLVSINDEVKPAKTTNSDDTAAVNEDAGCYDRSLDAGKRYVVRRLDGSLREYFLWVWYILDSECTVRIGEWCSQYSD